ATDIGWYRSAVRVPSSELRAESFTQNMTEPPDFRGLSSSPAPRQRNVTLSFLSLGVEVRLKLPDAYAINDQGQRDHPGKTIGTSTPQRICHIVRELKNPFEPPPSPIHP